MATAALGDAVFERLAATLPASELHSALIEVMRRRAADRRPAEVLAQYRRDRFVRPATVDQRESIAVDAHLLGAAEGFEAIELSPVTPLGTCSTVALTDQHRVQSALRRSPNRWSPSPRHDTDARVRRKAGEVIDVAREERLVESPGHFGEVGIDGIAGSGRPEKPVAKTGIDVDRCQCRGQVGLPRRSPHLRDDRLRRAQRFASFDCGGHQGSERAPVSVDRDQRPRIQNQRK